MAGRAQRARCWSVTLFSRVVAINAAVLVTAAILLAVSPATVSPTLQLAEAVVLAVGTVLMISVNLLLMRRVFGPLEQLTRVMRRVDPHAPGRRLVARARRFRGRRAARRVQRDARPARARAPAQRPARARGAGERTAPARTGAARRDRPDADRRRAPARGAAACGAGRAAGRRSSRRRRPRAAACEDMREIARGLRPPALDEFGLRSALVSLAAQVSDHSGVRVRPQLAERLPGPRARAGPRDLPRGAGEPHQRRPPRRRPAASTSR